MRKECVWFVILLGLPFLALTGITRAERVWMEAEAGFSITAPLQVISDTTASGGHYIAVIPGNNSTSNPPSTGVAKYRIKIREGGAYKMYLRVLCSPDVDADSSDSCWVRVQGATYSVAVAADNWIRNNNIDYQVANPQAWFWSQVRHYEAWPGDTFVEMTMKPGVYTVEIAYREDGLWIDGFLLTNDPDVDPATLPDVIPYIPEDIAYAPHPANGASDVPIDTVLSWRPADVAKTHDLYIGTNFDDVNEATITNLLGATLVRGLDANSYDPHGTLRFGTTYYWRVDEVNGAPDFTIHKGTVWSFTMEPYGYPVTPIKATASSVYKATASLNTGPEKTIDGSGLIGDQHSTTLGDMWVSKPNVTPIWIQYEFDKAYKLHQLWVWNSNQAMEESLGYGAKEVEILYSEDGQTWNSLGMFEFAQAPGEPTYVSDIRVDLGGVYAKYVKLDIKNSWGGAKQASIAEVRFFYVPLAAFKPEPADGATNVAVDAVLNWRPGRQAAKHQVYVGLDKAAVESATVPTATVTDHKLSLLVAGAEYERTYYWRVDEVNDQTQVKVWQGPVWSFSTPTYAVVDNFESYDDRCKRIFFTWLDGLGHSGLADCGVAPASGNGTGSTVGYTQATFAERTNVHSGSQAMPFWYDNTTGSGISETVRTFSPPQDWTIGGAKTLVLFFKGDPANSPGQLYVKINNTKLNYDGNPNALTTGLWNQWNIDLSSVSLKTVNTLTIGVSGSGKGVLYIDDIRLYRSAPATAAPTDPGLAALVAYYPFEGDAKDIAGKGYNGTLVNDPTFTDSKVGLGRALSLDGVNDFVELPIGNLISTLTSATISAWINFATSSTGSWVRVFDFGTGTTVYMFLSPRQGTTGTMRFAITTTSNTGESGVNSPRVLSAGWHHVAVVIDGTARTLRLYLDGESVASGTTTVLPKDLGVTTQNWLGRSQWSADGYYQGLIDDFRIYNKALSAGEVRYLGGDR